MAELNEKDKKLLQVTHEVSELLTSYKFEEAWSHVGELNALLKNGDYTLPEDVIDEMRKSVRSYYYQENELIKKARRAQVAIGHKLNELAEAKK